MLNFPKNSKQHLTLHQLSLETDKALILTVQSLSEEVGALAEEVGELISVMNTLISKVCVLDEDAETPNSLE